MNAVLICDIYSQCVCYNYVLTCFIRDGIITKQK